jgi:asparagine synthase (glutamine-hydrolysing)
MCGIAGFQGDFPEALLRRMTRCLAHRGPDDEGVLLLPACGDLPAVGLGHRRLSIIDLSEEGRQPMTVTCDACRAAGSADLSLIYNGEIYNYQSLRAELEAAGHVFHSATDSEVLLHLYAAEGPGMLRRLNGIFAFAIYDGRRDGLPHGVERGDVFVARDAIGVKPLYYAADRRGVRVASEIKALLQDPDLSREIDFEAVHQNLAYLWVPAPRTVLRSVRKLPPGCALTLRRGAVAREWRWYETPYAGPRLNGSRRQIADELRARVHAAVERQLVADVRVGAFLSGGLDSSAVVASMKRARPAERWRCYCIGFRDGAAVDGSPSDLPYARIAAQHLGVDLETVEVEPSIIDQLDRMLYHLDEPQADPAPINALLIAERAREDGVKVLLSGTGGDDIFSGYRRHQTVYLERVLALVPHRMRAALASRARAEAAGGSMSGSSVGRRLVKLFEHVDLPPDRRAVAQFWWSGEASRRALFSDNAAAVLRTVDTAAPLLASLERLPPDEHALNRLLHLETLHFLADHNLNYMDKMGMAAGIEVRVPLLDVELVDFAASIPPRWKQRPGAGKALFRDAMAPDLPGTIVRRRKTGFGVPLRRWLRTELRGRVDETLGPDRLAARGIFDPAAVRRLIELDRAGRIDAAYTIFALMCLELWFGIFIDGGLA